MSWVGGPRSPREFSVTEQITVGDITVPVPHAGKVLFPDDGITKEDLRPATTRTPPGGYSRGYVTGRSR